MKAGFIPSEPESRSSLPQATKSKIFWDLVSDKTRKVFRLFVILGGVGWLSRPHARSREAAVRWASGPYQLGHSVKSKIFRGLVSDRRFTQERIEAMSEVPVSRKNHSARISSFSRSTDAGGYSCRPRAHDRPESSMEHMGTHATRRWLIQIFRYVSEPFAR